MIRSNSNAFTMIELVFVIVILGIMAAVAIPKLSATRTDAQISKMATNLNTIISDLASSYTSRGTLLNWNDSTNVETYTSSSTLSTDSTSVTTAVYLYSGDNECIKLISTIDGDLTISKGSDTIDDVCVGVQEMEKRNLKIHSFGGQKVKY